MIGKWFKKILGVDSISINKIGSNITINGTTLTGKNLRIYVDDKEVELGEPIQSLNIEIHGNCGNVDTVGRVEVHGDSGDVNTTGRVTVGGNCENIDTTGKVEVQGSVKGHVDTVGSVRIGKM